MKRRHFLSLLLTTFLLVSCFGKKPITIPPTEPTPIPAPVAYWQKVCGTKRAPLRPINHLIMNTWTYAATEADLRRLSSVCNVAKFFVSLDTFFDPKLLKVDNELAALRWLEQERNWGIWNKQTKPYSLLEVLTAVDHCGIRIVLCIDSQAALQYHKGRKNKQLGIDENYSNAVVNIIGACKTAKLRIFGVQIENEPDCCMPYASYGSWVNEFTSETYAQRVKITQQRVKQRYPGLRIIAGGSHPDYGIAAWRACRPDLIGYHVVNSFESPQPLSWESQTHHDRVAALRAKGIPRQRIIADEVVSPHHLRHSLLITHSLKGVGWTALTGDVPWALSKIGRWHEVEDCIEEGLFQKAP